MTKFFVSGIIAWIMVLSLSAQEHDRKPMPSADRAKNTVERISKTVTFTKQQQTNIIAIFTTFYDNVRAQQAFRDPSKLELLEKARDAKVEKLLNNKKLFKQYQDAIREMKAQLEERKRQSGRP
jgi:hypothetical protein